MAEIYLLAFPRFPLRKKEHKSYFGKNRTHDFRTSRCAGYLLDHTEQVNHFFPYPPSRLRVWSLEIGSAVPSRVSPLILHTQTESSIINHQSSIINHQSSIWCLLTGFLSNSAAAAIFYTANRHRVSPEFIRSGICVPMAFKAESPPAQDQ